MAQNYQVETVISKFKGANVNTKKILQLLFYICCIVFLPIGSLAGVVNGELTKWHTVTIDFEGPFHDEMDSDPNPFLDYRLQVFFTAPVSGSVYEVPGFFDGDGNGGSTGSIWRVRFTPDEAGVWSYRASFRMDPEIAVNLDASAGAPASFDGDVGDFTIQDRNPDAEGFYKFGRLESIGEHYYKFRDGGYWIKMGVGSPEDFLGYVGFDNTPNASHAYSVHIDDWQPGDPDWDSPDTPSTTNDGRGIVGALNYLAENHINSIYFMPMNIGGDCKDVWPYADPEIKRWGDPFNDNLHYDISKLAQWEKVLAHAQRKAIFLHFVLNESEMANKLELDNATLGPERKLYYRELIARFGHHNALQWNICEEYNNKQFPLDPLIIKEFAQYISQVDPYHHAITVHNGGNSYRTALAPFVGDDRFAVFSIQTWQRPDDIGSAIEYFREQSMQAGQPVPVMVDESIGMNQISADDYRKRAIWDALFSGGGFELFTLGDSSLDDFGNFETYYRYAWYAREFMIDNLPFWEMEPNDDLVSGENSLHGGAEVFAKPGETYAIYLPSADQSASLALIDSNDWFEQRWFNPRTGQFEGDPITFESSFSYDLGLPPSDTQEDWVVLVQLVQKINNKPDVPDQSISTSISTPVMINLEYSDTDGPGPYTFTITTSPQHGVLSTVAADGTVTYTPDLGYSGSDSFGWRVNDGLADSAEATVTVNIGMASPENVFSPVFNNTSTWVVYKDTDNKDTKVITFADGGAPGEKYKVVIKTTTGDTINYLFTSKGSGYTGCDKSAYDGQWPGYRKIELSSSAGFAKLLKMKMIKRKGTGSRNAYVGFSGSGDQGWTQVSGPVDGCSWSDASGIDDDTETWIADIRTTASDNAFSPLFKNTSTWAVYKDTDSKGTTVMTFADGGAPGEKYKVVIRTTTGDAIIYIFTSKGSGYTGCDKSAYDGQWPGYRQIELGSSAGFAKLLKMKMIKRRGTGTRNAYVGFSGIGDEGWSQSSGPADGCGW